MAFCLGEGSLHHGGHLSAGLHIRPWQQPPSPLGHYVPNKWTFSGFQDEWPYTSWQVPKAGHPITGSHNTGNIVVATLEIYEYLKVAIIFSLSPSRLQKT